MTEEQAKELALLKGMSKGLDEAWNLVLHIDSIHELREAVAKRAMEQSAKYHAALDAAMDKFMASIKE